MFVGEFQHALDPKGRIILPARFRQLLADGAVMAKGPDRCIVVYPTAMFEEVAAEVREQSKQGENQRNAARAFFGGAAPAEPDGQGRVAIPQNLREFADLDRNVVVVGVYTRFEIWSAERWAQVSATADAALVAPDLPALGI